MTFEEKINAALKTAMLSKDEVATRSIRAIKAALIVEKTAPGAAKELSEDAAVKMLTKMVKQRRDSIDIFEKQSRADLAQKEKEEVEVLQRFLPAQMSEEEVINAVKAIILESGATAQDMGKVIGAANKAMAGKAEGRLIAECVKKLLTAS